MKLIEKLAQECVEKRRQEIFDNESQPSDPDWFIPVYEAGFRKARELIAEEFDSANGDWPLGPFILKVGEEEINAEQASNE